jgi:site-specific DNA-adenine methylase
MGGKRKIADTILHRIPAREHFYDMFGGSGTMALSATENMKWKTVHYNEKLKYTYQLFTAWQGGRLAPFLVKPKWIDRADWKLLHDKYVKYEDMTDEEVLLFWSFSFSTNYQTYAYAVEKEAQKKIDFLKCTSTPDWQGNLILHSHNCKDDIYKMVQTLCRIKTFVDTEPRPVTCTNLSYLDVPIEPNSVLYCDPPYAGTHQYYEKFNHDEFWDWVRNNPNPVFVSEYKAPEDIQVVLRMKHTKTISGNVRLHMQQRDEILFWNGK